MRRPGYVTAAIVLGVTMVAGGAFAADTTTDTLPAKKVLRGGYVTAGGFLGSVGKLNDAVVSQGYSGLKNYAYEIGLGTFSEHWRFVSALDLGATIWRPTHVGNTVTDVAGLTGTCDLGFNVLPPHKRTLLFPYLGVGLGMYELELRDKNVGFDNAVSQPVPTHDVTMWQRVGALKAGIGFDFLMPNRNHPDRARLVGLRTGYLYDPSSASDWKIHEVRVQDGPSLSASGFYAQIVLGKTARLPVHKKTCPCPVKVTPDQKAQ